jgi:hypothetical protein
MEPRGNRWQAVENPKALRGGSTSEKPVPWAATSCPSKRMVRRGSTVRVRQRALEKARKSALSHSDRLAPRRRPPIEQIRHPTYDTDPGLSEVPRVAHMSGAH